MLCRNIFLFLLVGILSACSSNPSSKDTETRKVSQGSLDTETENYALCIRDRINQNKQQGITNIEQLVDNGLLRCRPQARIVARTLLEMDGSVDPQYYDINIKQYVLPDIEEVMKEKILSSVEKPSTEQGA